MPRLRDHRQHEHPDLSALQAELERHLLAPSTRAIVGGMKQVVHFIDPVTGLNVIRDQAGALVSAWRFSPAQWKCVMTIGKLR